MRSVFSLEQCHHATYRRAEKCGVDADTNALYIHERHMDAFGELHRQLANYLSYNQTHSAERIRWLAQGRRGRSQLLSFFGIKM